MEPGVASKYQLIPGDSYCFASLRKILIYNSDNHQVCGGGGGGIEPITPLPYPPGYVLGYPPAPIIMFGIMLGGGIIPYALYPGVCI